METLPLGPYKYVCQYWRLVYSIIQFMPSPLHDEPWKSTKYLLNKWWVIGHNVH